MTKLEKIEAVKNLYEITNAQFTVFDGCTEEGWKGTLFDDGAIVFERKWVAGYFFKYEDMDDYLLDEILNEAVFDGYDFDNCTLPTLLKMVKENCTPEMIIENAQAFIEKDDDYKLFLLDCIKTKRNSKKVKKY